MNVSRDLFENSPNELLVVPVMKTGWCDWGREERILTTLQRHEALCHVYVSKLYPEEARGVSKREKSPSGRYEDHPEN
ncbi:MAG: hypothetical protein HY202_04560 [Nitrospirae bacterium]|nr:hypothetical protein [Nitrospirota bacterium]